MKLKYNRLAITGFLILFVLACYGQQNKNNDDLVLTLKNIRSKQDTLSVKSALIQLSQAPENVLIQKTIWDDINRIKGVIAAKDYVDLVFTYQSRLLDLGTPATFQKVLDIGQGILSEIGKHNSDYSYYANLFMFREMRKAFRNLGRLTAAVQFFGEAEKFFLRQTDSMGISIANNALAGMYYRLGIQEKAFYHQRKSLAFLNEKQTSNFPFSPAADLFGIAGKLNRYAVLGDFYLQSSKLKEADSCLKQAVKYYRRLDSPLLFRDVPYLFLKISISKAMEGDANSQAAFDTSFKYMQLYKSLPSSFAVFYQERAVDLIRLGKYDMASYYLKLSKEKVDSFNIGIIDVWGEITLEYYEAKIALLKGNPANAIRLLQIQLEKLKPLQLRALLIKTLELLAESYHTIGNHTAAYEALQNATVLNKKIIEDEKEARTISFETEKKLQENESAIILLNAKDEGNRKQKFYLFGIITLLAILAIVMFIFYRNKQKAEKALVSQNNKLAATLIELKSTQTQLVQSEKMASLGELTAGIAHEIQNPLNFVNNFSELNNELLQELGPLDKLGVTADQQDILKDLQSNSKKINHHGQRAAAIVKGMLQHSRTSSGQKEPTDINALCDEYLRLAYHGLRAKDKSFNAEFKTEFDETIPKVNIVPQDMGRVVLNLINNAFFAVAERLKACQAEPVEVDKPNNSDATLRQAQGDIDYNPLVTVTTKNLGNTIEITVSDNGTGIPSEIKEKIFQPFFTTKPTGQGTGLGLSLAYDIVTKVHSGKLTVESDQGKGTTFKIEIPMSP